MLEFLLNSTIFLSAAVVAVPLAKRLGLGSVLGYLLAGLVIGQVIRVVGIGAPDLQHFAETGIVMLLFVIGLELEPKTLWDMRHKLLGLGGLQIGLTTAALTMVGVMLGLTWGVSLAIGMALALSSTAMVLQTLSEKGLTQTSGGRSSLSVLLTQDVAVIPMLVLIPLLAAGDGAGGEAMIHHGEDGVEIGQSLVAQLPAYGVALVMLAAIAAVFLSGQYLVKPGFRYIAATGLMEISTAATLFIVAATALLMTFVGLSPALGTFLAGVTLANSEFRHEMESNIAPFKGLFLGLFFVTVGAGINFTILFSNIILILGVTLIVIIVKASILLVLAVVFRIRGRDRWLFTLGLAQAGEFGFVLIDFMRQTGALSGNHSDVLILVAAMSMMLTPLLFIAYDRLARRMGDAAPPIDGDSVATQRKIIIAGIGRFGQIVNQLVTASGYSTTVLDSDMEAIDMLKKLGIKAFLGDPSREQMLDAAGVSQASVLVVAVDEQTKIDLIVKIARRKNPGLCIIARAKSRAHMFALYKHGATQIVRETFDSSIRAGRYVLQEMGINEEDAHRRSRAFYRFDRHSNRELATLWDPDIPMQQNEPYIRRLRELNREIESNLGARFESGDTFLLSDPKPITDLPIETASDEDSSPPTDPQA